VGWFKAAFAAAAILIGGLGAAGAAGAAPALWVVKDADSEIYLFGTLHALDPATRWRTPLYDEVYRRAGAIWFEADIDRADPAAVMALVDRYGVDRRRRLSDKLAPQDLDRLSRQVDVARIDHLRPWAAALMLSMQPMMGRGARVEAGADLTMTRAARGQAKRIRTFETLEDQARLFAELPEDAELEYLCDVIRERGGPTRVRLGPPEPSLEKAWVSGDLARLGDGLVGDLRAENPAFYEALLKRRNAAWAEILVAAMAGQGTELVNVGALHMVGADGLPALLQARGFTVERVQ
jgi:uncharacterized protein